MDNKQADQPKEDDKEQADQPKEDDKEADSSSSGVPAATPPAVVPKDSHGDGGVGALQTRWEPGPKDMIDLLVGRAPILRTLYGDAGTCEVLASGIRVVERVVGDMSSSAWRSARPVLKVAAVAGLAAKLTQSCADEQHVCKLWHKIAGRSVEGEVRKLDRELVCAWGRQGLPESEYSKNPLQ